MSKLFLLSNNFSTHMLIYELDFVLKIDVEEIILLKENHSVGEFHTFNGEIPITLYSDINKCILNCDIVILFVDENIPYKSIDSIYNQSLFQGKRCIILNNPWRSSPTSFTSFEDNTIASPNVPVILNLSIGLLSQPYCMEVLLNKILFQNNFNITQHFSAQTNDLLLQLKTNDLLNPNFYISDIGDIFVYSIMVNENENISKEVIELINNIAPDYIIIQTDLRFEKYGEIKNFIFYNCYRQIDMIVKSHYINYNCIPVYCMNRNNQDAVSDNIYDLDSNILEETLSKKIITKIAFPFGIRPI